MRLKALTRYEGFGNINAVKALKVGDRLKALTRYEGFGNHCVMRSLQRKKPVEGTDPL